MSLKQAYMRKFVILDEQNINYSKANNQRPKGHVKLEVRDGKGKITLNVDGLNANISDENIYKGFILFNDNLKLTKVDVGSIIVNSNGRGSVEWQFNPLSVGGTGVSIDKFNVILVKLCSKKQQDEKLVVPLAGYIQDADDSVSMILDKLKKDIKNENKVEPRHYQKEEKKIEDSEEPIYIEVSETKESSTIEESDDFYENKIEEINIEEAQEDIEETQDIEEAQDIEETQETEEFQKTQEAEEIIEAGAIEELQEMKQTEEVNGEEEIEQQDEAVEDEVYEFEQLLDVNQVVDEVTDKIEGLDEEYEEDKYYDNKELKNTYNYNMYNDNTYGHSINRSNTYIENARNYSKQIANYAMNILKFFDRVNPFREALEGYKWWEIEYDSKNIYRGFLPFYNYLVNMYYPYPFMTKVTTCQSLIKRHNHYIFGVVEGQNEVQYYVYGVPGRFTREDQPYNGATGFTTWLRDKEKNKEDMGYWLIYIDALSGKIVTPLNPTIPPK